MISLIFTVKVKTTPFPKEWCSTQGAQTWRGSEEAGDPNTKEEQWWEAWGHSLWLITATTTDTTLATNPKDTTATNGCAKFPGEVQGGGQGGAVPVQRGGHLRGGQVYDHPGT